MFARPRPVYIVALVACLVPLAFAALTNHVWEDYLITLRASRNLVEGNGLVFNPGDRLHTFTSPLGVLVPALFTWMVGPNHEAAGIWLFRLFSAGVLAAALVIAWRRLQTLGVGRVGCFVALGLLCFDQKLVDFSTNGMETAMLVFFVLLLWSELERSPEPRAFPLALACAGLMWTRPDAFILGGALIVPRLIFRSATPETKPLTLRTLVVVVGIALAIYLPWLLIATWYYGTPIPHTIIAKSAVSPKPEWTTFVLMPWLTLKGDSMLMDLFLPTYWIYGGWPAQIARFGYVLSLIAAFAWIVPKLPSHARRLSLSVFLGMFYVCSIILFPWYSPPWGAIASLAVGCTLDALVAWAKARDFGWFVSGLRIAAAMIVAIQFAMLAATTWEMRTQQRLIENTVRRPIGEWLRANARPHDTVFLEPLGYIGYYSQLKTYDYPGLSSREVVATIRSGARRFTEVIDRLRPTWIVVRPFEIADASLPQNAVWRQYVHVRTWSARAELDAEKIVPGRGWLEHDAEFLVFHYEPVAPVATK